MNRRSLFTTLALAALLGLAFATPSQAGSTLVTTTASFIINAPPGTTASDFEFQFSPVDPITDLKIISTDLPSPTISEIGTNSIAVDFTPSNGGFVNFSFLTSATPSSVGVLSFLLTDPSAPIKNSTVSVAVSAGTVPEPGSLALLGIGMTGFLAFRRFLKRNHPA